MADQPETAIEITCPHCKHLLTIDAASQEVLKCKEPARVKKTLADMLAEQETAKDKRAAAFAQAAEAERTKADRLRAKFQQAMAAAESAPTLDSDFPRDIDL